jgi:hypothetical protein
MYIQMTLFFRHTKCSKALESAKEIQVIHAREPQIYALQILQLIVATGLIVFLISCAGTTCTSIELAGNGVCYVRELLLLLLKVFRSCSGSVLLEPLGGLLDGVDKLKKMLARNSSILSSS